jgi:hypothetical protein
VEQLAGNQRATGQRSAGTQETEVGQLAESPGVMVGQLVGSHSAVAEQLAGNQGAAGQWSIGTQETAVEQLAESPGVMVGRWLDLIAQ